MFRFLAKSLIDRAAKRGAALPRWLQRRVDRDPELQRFAAASRGLATRLRGDAASWMAMKSDEHRGLPTDPARERTRVARSMLQRRSGARTILAYALAASLLAIAAWRVMDDPAPPPSPADHLAGQRISPEELDQLLTAWRSGRSLADAWQARVQSAASRIDDVARIDPALIVSRFDATRAAARIRTTLDIAVIAPQRELATGMKSAYDFFARRLGASIAQLVGLQSG
jgi:hypothetical protein